MNGEPVPLGQIAVAIRDESWLDMHVCDLGKLDRVRISQLNISRERDEVVVGQRWLGQETGGPAEDPQPRFHDETYTFDVEEIIRLRETRVALKDVKPIKSGPVPVAPDIFDVQAVIDEIVRTMGFTAGVSQQDLRSPKGRGDKALRPRQEAMWLAYEMTNLSPPDICINHFGYRSQAPLVAVERKLRSQQHREGKVHFNELAGAWEKRVKAAADLIDSHFGRKFRRSNPAWGTIL